MLGNVTNFGGNWLNNKMVTGKKQIVGEKDPPPPPPARIGLRESVMPYVRKLIRYDTVVMIYKINYGLPPLNLMGIFHTVDGFPDKPVRNNTIHFLNTCLMKLAKEVSPISGLKSVTRFKKKYQKTQHSPLL